jgi:hypothetical protein
LNTNPNQQALAPNPKFLSIKLFALKRQSLQAGQKKQKASLLLEG